jgi:hypothetical protein
MVGSMTNKIAVVIELQVIRWTQIDGRQKRAAAVTDFHWQAEVDAVPAVGVDIECAPGLRLPVAAVVLWLATGRYMVHVENLEYVDAQAYLSCRHLLLAAGWAACE